MPLSANTVFHFTEEKNDLINILQDNFHVKYCSEKIFIGKRPLEFKVPMVCFCDIPLSEIKNHIDIYGPYGIGLSKDWAKRSRLNPVLYIDKGSLLSQSLVDFTSHIVNTTAETNQFKTQAFFDVLRYMKNYEGPLIRKNKIRRRKYRFTDEREWRYVPEYANNIPMFWTSRHPPELCPIAKQDVAALRLRFEPNDIKYVIVKSESERTEFINHLRDAKETKYDPLDVDRLTSRILTNEQILADI